MSSSKDEFQNRNSALKPDPFFGAIVYLLRCADGSYYCGTARQAIEARVAEHNDAIHPDSYTASRRPVVLVWSEHYQQITEAIAMERRIKGWSRAKKAALIRGDWEALKHHAVAYERRGDR
jgi:putative endonuclease